MLWIHRERDARIRASNGYTRGITTTLVGSLLNLSRRVHGSLARFYGMDAERKREEEEKEEEKEEEEKEKERERERERKAKGERKRKRSTQTSGCRVTERRCGWRGTRGAASCDGGGGRSWLPSGGGAEGEGGGGNAGGRGRSERSGDWRAVSQPCFVVEMRTQRGMTSHDPTFARRQWHVIKTARGSFYVHGTCRDHGFGCVSQRVIVDHSCLAVREACFPGCATVRCAIPVSPSSAFLASIGVSLRARRGCVSTPTRHHGGQGDPISRRQQTRFDWRRAKGAPAAEIVSEVY